MKNGVYLNLVKYVRQAFEESELVKIAAPKEEDALSTPNKEEGGHNLEIIYWDIFFSSISLSQCYYL